MNCLFNILGPSLYAGTKLNHLPTFSSFCFMIGKYKIWHVGGT